MTRRVLEQFNHSIDFDRLQVVTVFETGAKKEDVKRTNIFSKRHSVLILENGNFKYKGQ